MSTQTRSATARMNRGRDSSSSDKSGPAKDMYESFQSWALQNYGDSAKTKTVTRKKNDRIVRILNGEEQSTSENSKFRFWVKAKGFRLGSLHSGDSKERKTEPTLYVPSKQTGGTCLDDGEQGEKYKRVAVVEDFFDIIYGVHVEMDGRGGKHAGQKRTYKAIAETYAFLPREAVTRFLMSCSDCQKRMHLTGENNNHETATPAPPEIDFSLPITTTYLNHMRTLGYTKENLLYPEDSISTPDSDISREDSPSGDKSCSPKSPTQNKGNDTDTLYTNNFSQTMKMSASPGPSPYPAIDEPLNMSKSKHNDWSEKETKMEVTEDKVKKERINDEESVDSSCNGRSSSDITGGAEDLSSGNKDPDDDDEDDVEDKIDDQKHDPERLKAFNMFVRLFVDENLDRMVPISKQPKEKIQAIIESCNRQFPEFQERARKRIRTYLKSCRRMKRSKDHNSWGDTSRPTPPHLTSAMAESILAAACESESKNAKRMRMGMDPLPTVSQPPVSINKNELSATDKAPSRATSENHVSRPSSHLATSNDHSAVLTNGNVRSSLSTLSTCGRGQSSVIQRSSPLVSAALNGPTDLSLKKSQPKCQLNPSEVAAVKQLIAGYRESAAFLYRSADELEQLLVQQN